MPDDTTESEAKLRKLAERLHRGWEKLHPVTEKELAAVRQVVRAQWEHEQQVRHRVEKAQKAAESTQTKPAAEQKKEKKAQEQERRQNDQTHKHGH
jgi:hypothetical protein